jgi:hypothetical protein
VADMINRGVIKFGGPHRLQRVVVK